MSYTVPQKKHRLREKPSSKNKPKITQHERDYLQWFAEQSFACFACGTFHGVQGHHIKEFSTDKKNHTQMLPLCSRCHTGPTLSPHGTPKKWRETFPIYVQREQSQIYYNQFLKEIE